MHILDSSCSFLLVSCPRKNYSEPPLQSWAGFFTTSSLLTLGINVKESVL